MPRDQCRNSCRPIPQHSFASHRQLPGAVGPNRRDRCFPARRPRPEPISRRESKPNRCQPVSPNARSDRPPSRTPHSKSKSSLDLCKPNVHRCTGASCRPNSRYRAARLFHKSDRQTNVRQTASPDKIRRKTAPLRRFPDAPLLNRSFHRTSKNLLPAAPPVKVASPPSKPFIRS